MENIRKETQKRQKRQVKSGDNVIVITGNHKGKVGKILKRRMNRVVVQGVNVCTKHVKPSQQGQQGSILHFERPIDISNVKLYDESLTVVKT